MIKAIIFDVGGVLSLGKYDRHGSHGHHLMGVHHFMADYFKIDIDSWFDAIDTVYAKSIEGKVSRRNALYSMAVNLKTTSKHLEKVFLKAYKQHFVRNDELYKIAYKLKKNGYRIGILSDQWYLSKDALILQKDMAGFRPVIISCDTGIRKPNPKIYQLLIKKTRLNPDEILFIDNREWNLKPARKLGIKTILFSSNKKFLSDLALKGIVI